MPKHTYIPVILWLVLAAYTAIYLTTSQREMVYLEILFRFEADPLINMVFNLLGLFPLILFMYALTYERPLHKKLYVGHFLGFATGAFGLLPAYFESHERVYLKPARWVKAVTLFSFVSTLILMIYGFALGSFSSYISAFQSDALIHIMTIDLLILYLFSIYLSYRSKHQLWYLVFIPIIGLVFPILINRKEPN
jgi:hypothetical protein